MPVWVCPVLKRMKVGQPMPGHPGMWVAEIVERVPTRVLIQNYHARKWNEQHPDEPALDFDPEMPMRHARLCGAQLRLSGF